MTKPRIDLEMAEQLFRAGTPTRDISFRLGIGPNKVRELRKKLGFKKVVGPTTAMRESVKMGWIAMVNSRKRVSVFISDEEVEAMKARYLAQGGTIKHCPPMGALGDIPLEVAA